MTSTPFSPLTELDGYMEVMYKCLEKTAEELRSHHSPGRGCTFPEGTNVLLGGAAAGSCPAVGGLGFLHDTSPPPSLLDTPLVALS